MLTCDTVPPQRAPPVLSNMAFSSSHCSQLCTWDRNSQVTELEDSESRVPLNLYLSNAAKLWEISHPHTSFFQHLLNWLPLISVFSLPFLNCRLMGHVPRRSISFIFTLFFWSYGSPRRYHSTLQPWSVFACLQRRLRTLDYYPSQEFSAELDF